MIKGEKMITEINLEEGTPERVYSFSDGVFSIIITIMILELKEPKVATFGALFQLWPTWLSYCVSYIFVAIIWINHHYLMRYAKTAKLRLMWANFAHLFSVSLIPFSTKWVSDTRLQSVPVIIYALIFVLANVTYLWLVKETIHGSLNRGISGKAMKLLHLRGFITLALFTSAMIIAIWFPFGGFGLIACCLSLYVRPALQDFKS
jgi:uncharacterized membrane protein